MPAVEVAHRDDLAVAAHMTVLEQTPEWLIGFFQDRHVKYAVLIDAVGLHAQVIIFSF